MVGTERRPDGPTGSQARLSGIAFAGLLLLSAPVQVAACAFHTVLPTATLVEDIASSVEVIAARPSAADPFSYETVAVLRGEASGFTPPYIVDSVTRARLAKNADEAVLFARNPDGNWIRLFTLDATTRPFVDQLMKRADIWASPEGAVERRDLVAGLLAHPDARLRRIALRELDGLPYDILRGGTYPISPADLLQTLSDVDQMPFAPISILLLGLSDNAHARDAVAQRLAGMAESGSDFNLGPWITAAVESGGAAGIAAVERQFLTTPERLSQPQLVAIIRALSVLSAQGDPALRAPLDQAILKFVTRRSDAAPLIAQAFGVFADYSQIAVVRDAAAARPFTDRDQVMAVLAYVSRAGETPANSLQKRGIQLSSEGQ
jgi:hypothetical protein